MKLAVKLICCALLSLAFYSTEALCQDQCPRTLEDVQKDNGYSEAQENWYRSSKLLCRYENKKLVQETSFVNNKKEGPEKTYYPDGQIETEINYVSGKKKGLGKEYYKSGKIKIEIQFVEGISEGISKVYRDNGKLFATITYEKGVGISGVCHHTNGTESPWTSAKLSNLANGLPVECE